MRAELRLAPLRTLLALLCLPRVLAQQCNQSSFCSDCTDIDGCGWCQTSLAGSSCLAGSPLGSSSAGLCEAGASQVAQVWFFGADSDNPSCFDDNCLATTGPDGAAPTCDNCSNAFCDYCNAGTCLPMGALPASCPDPYTLTPFFDSCGSGGGGGDFIVLRPVYAGAVMGGLLGAVLAAALLGVGLSFLLAPATLAVGLAMLLGEARVPGCLQRRAAAGKAGGGAGIGYAVGGAAQQQSVLPLPPAPPLAPASAPVPVYEVPDKHAR